MVLAQPSMLGLCAMQGGCNTGLSDWGGKLRTGESTVDGALREFDEESGGLINMGCSREELKAAMEKLSLPVLACINMARVCTGIHRTYVVLIPHDSHLPERFNFHWNHLMQLLPAHTRLRRARQMSNTLHVPTVQHELQLAEEEWLRRLDDSPESIKSHPAMRHNFSMSYLEKGGCQLIPFPSCQEEIRPRFDGERVRAVINTVTKTLLMCLQ